MKLNDETIIQKFLKRINNSVSTPIDDLNNNTKFLDNFKEEVILNDLNPETLKKLSKNSNLRIYCVDGRGGLGYNLPKNNKNVEGGKNLTKKQLREYVSDESEEYKTLGELSAEFSSGYDDALLIGRNLNEEDVESLYFGSQSYSKYLDITEWFIEFLELYCSTLTEIPISSNYYESLAKFDASNLDGYKIGEILKIEAVCYLELQKERSGKYGLRAMEIFQAFGGLGNGELDPAEACDFDFGDLIKSSPRYVGSILLDDEYDTELEAAIIPSMEYEWQIDHDTNFQLYFYLEEK